MSSKNLSNSMGGVASKNNIAYAIDFGTTNSTVALCDSSGVPIAIPIEQSSDKPQIVRSVIYISPKHEYLFGQKAIIAYIKDVAEGKAKPPKLIWTGKYINIAKFSPTSGFKGEEMVPEIIEVEEGSTGRLLQSLKTALSISRLSKFNILGKEYSIEELIGLFLRHLREEADRINGSKIENVLLGRPVNFVGENDSLAESRLRKAAGIAGFKKVSFEYEPVGAAWNYRPSAIGRNQIVFVFDFGGGTLDYSIVRFPGKHILCNYGLPLGGDLFDSELFDRKIAKYFGSQAKFGTQQLPLPNYIFKSLENWYMISLLKTKKFMDTLEDLRYMNSDAKALSNLETLVFKNLGFSLYDEIDRNKKALSFEDKTTLTFDKEGIVIREQLKRSEFEAMIKSDIEDIKVSIDDTLKIANLKLSDIDFVVTTGGSSLIPAIRKMLVDKFGQERIFSQDPFTSVALGLALRTKEIVF